MSSGCPWRCSGSWATRFALAVPDSVPASASRRANVLSISSVSTVPGATQLTRIAGAYSSASCRVSPISAHFVAT